jgi:long-subunit fatty acid transport protein
MKRRSFALVLMMLLFAANRADASTDINCMWDARSGGMGGTGVAFLDSPAAVPTNPALLDQIGKLTISADLFLIAAQPEAPYTIYHLDPATGTRQVNYETIRSETASAVLPFFGAAFRIVDRVVFGVAAYPVIGQGTDARYQPAPEEFPQLWAHNKAAMGLFEISNAVSVRIIDNLSIAAAWRINYMSQQISTPLSTGGPPAGVAANPARTEAVNANINVTGLNFAGFQLGLFWKPVPSLRLGFSYRSKVVAEGSGTTETTIGTMTTKIDTKSEFTNPHAFRAGLAWSLLSDSLLLAVDFKYLMYAEAYKNTPAVTTVMNGKEKTDVRPAFWKDSFVGMFGAEVKALEALRLRAGYIILNSATDPDYAQQLMAPPGIQHLVSAGLGVKALDSLNVDVSAAYLVLQSRVEKATPYNAGVGIYASHGVELSLSAVYHN